MILDQPLKNLEVQVTNGGSLITHRAVFTPDSKSLMVVSGNKVLIYSLATSACVGKIEPLSGEDICNIVLDPTREDTLVVCTVRGHLYWYEISTGALKADELLNLTPLNWTITRITSVVNFIYPGPRKFYLLVNVEGYSLPTIYSVTDTPDIAFFLERVCVDIQSGVHSVALGASGEFLAGIKKHALYVRDCSRNVDRLHLYGERALTSVAVHPLDWICATGDDTGRILLWANALQQNCPAKTVFHWHTLPLRDLSFSADGSQIFSGGGESTLVKWDLSNTENKRTIPRLGLPIRHVAVSSRNTLAAVSQSDNSIKIISAHNKVIGTIQNLTQCYIPEDENDTLAAGSGLGGARVYQAGLVEDPNRNALVMNGKPGQLQCYSFSEDKHLYDLDITQQNYITAERHKTIPFSEVNHMSFSKNGLWLATSESRQDKEKFTEIKLKFWKFDSTRQKFTLNTSIEWPHENGVNDLKIQPIDDEDSGLIAATSGGDKKFKTWGIVHDTSIHRKSEWWNCENVGTHRDHHTGRLCFSKDGSLLAVSFSRILSLWTTDTHEFKGALSHQRIPEPLKFVEFGTRTCSHLVICCTENTLAVWDVIAFSMLWAIPLQVESLAVDSFSEDVAVFSSKNHAYVFHASNPEPLAVYNHVSKSKILSSTFVSSYCAKMTRTKSTLLFMNASQELCSFAPKSYEKDKTSIKYGSKAVPLTPFAQMVAEKTVLQNSAKKIKFSMEAVGVMGAQIIQAVIESSPHTMPSISFFCEQLLNSTTVKINASERFQEMEKLVLDSHLERGGKLPEPKEVKQMEVEINPSIQAGLINPPNPAVVAQENTSWIHEIIFA